ncbi:MAG: hypothetical protein BMS9Abin36_0934 [Gammaproteobacteria bacterium]|nr:MAG: hypothetical protein BMS9Abin36_0934 [Gammaproteobacteria bacterium]
MVSRLSPSPWKGEGWDGGWFSMGMMSSCIVLDCATLHPGYFAEVLLKHLRIESFKNHHCCLVNLGLRSDVPVSPASGGQ